MWKAPRLAFNGVQFTLTGTPAAGDTFTVRSAGTRKPVQDAGRPDRLRWKRGARSPQQQRAAGQRCLNKALAQLDQGLNHVIDLRTEIGARLSSLDPAASLRDDLELHDDRFAVQACKDMDYAEAISTPQPADGWPAGAQAAYTQHRADVPVRLLALSQLCAAAARRCADVIRGRTPAAESAELASSSNHSRRAVNPPEERTGRGNRPAPPPATQPEESQRIKVSLRSIEHGTYRSTPT